MGLSGIGPGSLLLIAIILVLLFGTQRLRSLGRDVGEAVKGFQNAMRDEGESAHDEASITKESSPASTKDPIH